MIKTKLPNNVELNFLIHPAYVHKAGARPLALCICVLCSFMGRSSRNNGRHISASSSRYRETYFGSSGVETKTEIIADKNTASINHILWDRARNKV